ncbi:MAG: hypothetical protein KC621_08695 [Myxococcales bacterium]|nr:hypothetical protein [Myxococcales bacterium]
MNELTPIVCVVAPLVVAPLTFVLLAVPAAGAWLSGTPSRPVLARWVAAVMVTMGGGSAVFGDFAAWQYWTGAIGPWFPFAVEVPDGTLGLVAVEMCPQGDRTRVVVIDKQGSATIARDDWDHLYGRRRILVHERSGRSLDAQSYGYDVDLARGCSLLMLAVHPTSAWSVPNPMHPSWSILDESRAERLPFDQIAQRYPGDRTESPAIDTGP